MKKIVFGITSLTIGGAERVLVDIANKLKDNYDITIFCLYSKGPLKKELSDKIKVIELFDKSYSEIKGIKKKFIPIKVLICGKLIYKKYIKGRYDVQISFLESAITRIFSNGKKIKKITWLHNDITKVFGKGLKSKIKLLLDKKIYKKYDKIVFVSNDNKKAFNNLYNIKNIEEKEIVIYNYIDKQRVIKKSNEKIEKNILDLNVPSIIVVARLVPQKAIERLIKVHKKLINENVWHKIYVIGDGPEKKKLENLIKENNLDKTFILLGEIKNPYPYMKKANYFALLSYFEGYGIVIDEAKILNKKIIITETAAKEALNFYSKKLIVENNEDSIYKGLEKVLNKQIEFEDNKNDFSNEHLIKQIEELISITDK